MKRSEDEIKRKADSAQDSAYVDIASTDIDAENEVRIKKEVTLLDQFQVEQAHSLEEFRRAEHEFIPGHRLDIQTIRRRRLRIQNDHHR